MARRRPSSPPPAQVELAGVPVRAMHAARIYLCGVTPYDVTHLGHASTFVWVDAAVSVLRDAGYQPVLARNVTDVDDVLSAAAAARGADTDRFAYLQQYDVDRDLAALAVARPDHEPRSRHHVDAVVALVAGLVERGAAYVGAGGSVYLEAGAVRGLQGRAAEQVEASLREYAGRLDDPDKRDPRDAAVWQAVGADDEAALDTWDSPWGPGRPGWHAQCAAMVLATYGPSVDVHAGGADLEFPHHAYEAAIIEAFSGVHPAASCWFRPGTVLRDGEKMAKSSGNLLLVDDLVRRHGGDVVRATILGRRWDEPWELTDSDLGAARQRLESLRSAAGRHREEVAAEAEVRRRLRADLDVVGALDTAVEAGGSAATLAARVLKLEPASVE